VLLADNLMHFVGARVAANLYIGHGYKKIILMNAGEKSGKFIKQNESV